jgi:hypothetical protein
MLITMKHLWLALALALVAAPVAALADDNPPAAPASALTPAQRQAMYKTMQTFRDKERELHQQMRSQILSALTPAHRNAVAGVIGEMVIADKPDPIAAAKQIDGVLSPGEQQAILAAHNAFVSQSQTLLQQMHAQLQSELPPAAMQGHPHGENDMHRPPSSVANDAGSVLMMVLAHRAPMGMEMSDHHPDMMRGAPPPGAPPSGQEPPPGAPPPAR